MVACGDREDCLQFLRTLSSQREAKCAETAKEKQAEPLPEGDF